MLSSAEPIGREGRSLRDKIPLTTPNTGETWLGDGNVELGLEVLSHSHLLVFFAISTFKDKGLGFGILAKTHDGKSSIGLPAKSVRTSKHDMPVGDSELGHS